MKDVLELLMLVSLLMGQHSIHLVIVLFRVFLSRVIGISSYPNDFFLETNQQTPLILMSLRLFVLLFQLPNLLKQFAIILLHILNPTLWNLHPAILLFALLQLRK